MRSLPNPDLPQAGDVGFDDVDGVQRRYDRQLQVHAPEQLEAVARRFIGAAAESLAVDHAPEGRDVVTLRSSPN